MDERRKQLLIEANRRGILPPEKKAMFDEAVRRGLINLPNEEPKEPTLTEQTFDESKQSLLNPLGVKGAITGEGEDLVNQVGQGATFGFLDEAQAGLYAALGVGLPESLGGLPEGVGYSEAYKGIRDEIRGKNKAFEEENPKTAVAAQVAGGLASGGAGLAKGMTKVDDLVSASNLVGKKAAATKIAGAAVTGGIEGALAGAGFSNAETLGEVKDDAILGGAIGATIGGLVGGVATGISSRIKSNKALKEIVQSSPDAEVATKVIKNGKVATLKEAKRAIDQGFSEGSVFVVRTASDATRKSMKEMVNAYRRIAANPRNRRKQVSDVVGKAALKRYNALKQMNRTASKQIDSAANSLKNYNVDVSQEIDSFLTSLDDVGVNIQFSGAKPRINYQGSDFEGLPEAQRIINNVVNRASNTKVPNAYDVHRMKKFIDNNVSFGASNKTGAEAKAEQMIKGFRRNLDKYLDGLSEQYDKANTKYASTINPIKEIESLAGKNGVTERTLGLLANRTDSRAVSSGRVAEVFDELDEVTAQYGVKFKDSVSDLHIFANEMDQVLKNQRNNTLKGQIAQQDLQNPVSAAIGKATGYASNKVFGVNEKTKIQALRDLLEVNGSFGSVPSS